MQVPFRVGLMIGGLLVEAHGVREWNQKETVVTRGDFLEDAGESQAASGIEFGKRRDMLHREQDGFERPDGPEGHEDDEVFIPANDAVAGL